MKAPNKIREHLIKKIGFLDWVELDRENVFWIAGDPGHNWQGQVFLSPDVNSLHLIWTWPQDKEAEHTWIDYPDDWEEVDFGDWVGENLFVSSHETISLDFSTVYEILSDFQEWTPENVKVVILEELKC